MMLNYQLLVLYYWPVQLLLNPLFLIECAPVPSPQNSDEGLPRAPGQCVVKQGFDWW